MIVVQSQLLFKSLKFKLDKEKTQTDLLRPQKVQN